MSDGGSELEALSWIPPYVKAVRKIDKFYGIRNGKLVEISIAEKPKDLSKLFEWIEQRKQMGKPLIVHRTYLVQAKKHAICIQLHEEHAPVFISLPELDVYIKRTFKQRALYNYTALRYILYYCGYKLKYRSLNIKAQVNKIPKLKQLDLCRII